MNFFDQLASIWQASSHRLLNSFPSPHLTADILETGIRQRTNGLSIRESPGHIENKASVNSEANTGDVWLRSQLIENAVTNLPSY